MCVEGFPVFSFSALFFCQLIRFLSSTEVAFSQRLDSLFTRRYNTHVKYALSFMPPMLQYTPAFFQCLRSDLSRRRRIYLAVAGDVEKSVVCKFGG